MIKNTVIINAYYIISKDQFFEMTGDINATVNVTGGIEYVGDNISFWNRIKIAYRVFKSIKN